MSIHSKALNFHLETLEMPLIEGETLLLNAEPGAYLNHLQDHSLTVVSALANTANRWRSEHKVEVLQDSDVEFDTIIHFATKFATENIATIGKYIQQLKPGGTWISVIPNKAGASRLMKDIKKLMAKVEASSKSKCRIFQASAEHDAQLARKWNSLNRFKAIQGTDFVTVPGVFSAEKIDTGSLLLAEYLKRESWYGSVADLGAGYGFLSHCVLSTPRQKIKNLCLYELDHRALECAKKNLAAFDRVQYHWTDVTAEVPHQRLFDTVIMNPPFHEAQDASFELGKTFIRQAASILKPGGTLYLVANLHLPYENVLLEHFRSDRLLAESNGFKVFLARK